ncbi:MAG: 50S ribosomal protein L24 [Candidatus Diapherotrites archaeon CG09_land_8_20_14_0_10_32_12]|nr:MAG: 50S ribosomal protein L24 [Candidatus Diapherotrites archaeon CG09_land_8_20_14_0_10_32_12]
MVKSDIERKRKLNASLHKKQKELRVHLSKELRDKYKMRALQVRKDDIVKVMVGKYKGKEGKIVKASVADSYVNIDNLKIKKVDGKEIYVKFQPSNLIIKELSLNDNIRLAKLKREKKVQKMKLEKKETPKKVDTKKESKTLAPTKASTKVVKKVVKKGE